MTTAEETGDTALGRARARRGLGSAAASRYSGSVSERRRDAWVPIPSEEDMRAFIPADRPSPYDFGFLPAMGRLLFAHPQVGPFFGALFARIMFEPGHLERREREMIAAVAAAAQDCHY